jgi:NAD(P)-dependent dehydrogenase (short-subunit alcohol dehydrogenase family)
MESLSLGDKDVVVVTGGYSGIGLEVSLGVMRSGGHVIVAGRTISRCEEMAREIKAMGLSGTCDCMALDLDDPKSIRAGANAIGMAVHSGGRRLHALVNNAGIMGRGGNTMPSTWWVANAEKVLGSRANTPSAYQPGNDPHLGPNHFGPFLLTSLLLKDIQRSKGRVVNVSSNAHSRFGSLEIKRGVVQNNTFLQRYWPWQYGRSKLCNVLHALGIREKYPDIPATSISPGPVRTPLFNSLPWPFSTVVNSFAKSSVGLHLFRTPEQGAASVLMAVLDPSLSTNDKMPLYIHDCKERTPSSQARDVALADSLWKSSKIYCNLT